MPTVKPEPPPLYNWMAVPYDDYERCRRAEHSFRRQWYAGRTRKQIREREASGVPVGE